MRSTKISFVASEASDSNSLIKDLFDYIFIHAT